MALVVVTFFAVMSLWLFYTYAANPFTSCFLLLLSSSIIFTIFFMSSFPCYGPCNVVNSLVRVVSGTIFSMFSMASCLYVCGCVCVCVNCYYNACMFCVVTPAFIFRKSAATPAAFYYKLVLNSLSFCDCSTYAIKV